MRHSDSWMYAAWLRCLGIAILACTLPCLGSLAGAQDSHYPASNESDARIAVGLTHTPGQSATQLADGRWLLIGGAATPDQMTMIDVESAKETILPTRLLHPRRNHTATLLPDGTILIAGGTDAAGRVVNDVERFEPTVGRFVDPGNISVSPRSEHTVTILADGRLFVAGGIYATGVQATDAEVCNVLRGGQCVRIALDSSRRGHAATLLPDGTVVLTGGTDAAGHGVLSDSVFDPVTEHVSPISAARAMAAAQELVAAAPPSVLASQPASDAVGVPVDQPFAMRFSERMAVQSISARTVTLIGPTGPTAVRVMPLQGGVLMFVTPSQDLLPGAYYTLFVKGATDTRNRPLPFTAIGFTTAQLNGAAGGPASDKSTALGKTSGTVSSSITAANRPAQSPVAVARGGSTATGEAGSIQIPSALQTQTADVAIDSDVWIPSEVNYHGAWISGWRHLSRNSLPQRPIVRNAIHGDPDVVTAIANLRPMDVAKGALRPINAAAAARNEALSAGNGTTAVAGQVLKLNGSPLSNVSLTMDGIAVKTDVNGEFLLAGVTSGHQVLVIDGSTASNGTAQYGRYEYGLQVLGSKTNALPFAIWMSKLDTQHAITIASPTTQSTVITNPLIPGLQLTLPQGTVVRDAQGKIVTTITITAIPTDQPPFPIPDLPVPTYFTIQPGGAHLENADGSVSAGAQLIYPNFTHSRPGTRIDFWNYDSGAKGWYIYGQGTVVSNGLQIVPDPGVVIYEFSGAMVALPSIAPSVGPTPGGCQSGDPVDCATGLFLNEETDLVIPDVIPIAARRSYRQMDNTSRGFGVGTNLSYDMFTVGTTNPYTYQDLILPDGTHIHYPRISAGTSYSDAVYQNLSTPGPYYGSIIKLAGSDQFYWQLQLKDGTSMYFPDSDGLADARGAALQGISDRNGNTVTLSRSTDNLTQITSPNGRHLNLTYDATNRVTQVSDDLGRTVTYAYNSQGCLQSVTDPLGNKETFTYDSNNNMLTVTDKRGKVRVTNNYDKNSRVIKQTYADGTTGTFAYTLNSTGTAVTKTNFTDQRGTVRQMIFNSSGYPTTVIDGLGTSIQQTTTFNVNSNNLVTSLVDALSRTTAYTYDPLGNITKTTFLAGTANAVSNSVTYDPIFSQPTSWTDPNGNVTKLGLDAHGNTTTITDALSHVTTIAYDGQGRPLTVTDPLGHTTTLSYLGANPSVVADALGRRTLFQTDIVGRLTGLTDSLQAKSSLSYDFLNRPLTFTNASGGVLKFAYDANNNLLTLTDPNGHATSYSYDALNRPSSKKDALGQTETYAYEPGGELNKLIDRKGQLTGLSFDALGRPTLVGYGASTTSPTAYTSTVSLTWDAGNRLTSLVDSSGGTITHSYDGLNRLTQEVTPEGTINYTYDAAGKRTGMTVQGQPTMSYSWDSANRLLKIQQAAGTVNGNTVQTVAFQYDGANRRTQTTLTNGVAEAYAYDNSNELTGITYTQAGGSALGNLVYSYDADGHRTSVGGSLANSVTPSSSHSATFDANNRLTVFNGQTYAYDADGNLINDGVNAYTWNARNQLVAISGGVTASFTYDAFGRRTNKTINGNTTNLLYDGANVVQELSGTTPSANYVTGLSIDATFARNDSNGMASFLTDALGSTLALTTSAGSISTRYTYDPYGATTSTGAASANPMQYTGRENDGTGLYFNRARYYSPKIGRFISEDPIGIRGGTNVYAYARGNPIIWTDRRGLSGEMSFPPESGGMSYPPDSVPGGPYTPAGPGQAPETFFGPPQETGPRAICRAVPPEAMGGPPGSTGYWKYQLPGQKGWSRVNPSGQPISPEQAHPGSAPAGDPVPVEDPAPIIPEDIPVIDIP